MDMRLLLESDKVILRSSLNDSAVLPQAFQKKNCIMFWNRSSRAGSGAPWILNLPRSPGADQWLATAARRDVSGYILMFLDFLF